MNITPENILFRCPGPIKDNPIHLTGFGLSQNFDKLKKPEETSYYSSPEVLKGNFTHLCDIWSAGVLLYYLLSGELPFKGDNDTIIYSNISEMKYSFPEDKWKNISESAKDLIRHMLAPEKERFTARDVLSHYWFVDARDLNKVK